MTFQREIKKYDYDLPEELIAQDPVSPRDSARLLVYDRKTGEVSYSHFRDLVSFLPKNAVLVFNETKVLPARLSVKKESGGMVKILYLAIVGKCIRVFSNRPLHSGAELTIVKNLGFIVEKKDDKYYLLRPTFPLAKLYDVLERYGTAPIPPYIKHSKLKGKALRAQYETVFAKHRGSVAAPTASLHFTRELLVKIRRAGIAVKFVTLHVNLGTFAPLTEAQWRKGLLHEEEYMIDARTATFLNKSKKEGRPIIAVGTTVARTLESAAASVIPGLTRNPELKVLSGSTRLFIREGDKFKFVQGLITNFHVPQSSLLMLVAALTGRKKLMELYQNAIHLRFRFFSFGDGMLVR
ncbi:MAG: tRNA preQ1(34) S-adenosylmethionine ribosyltransferase-isomerase QueA [bacterium]|nr:tRNA preQ1(34) S-adenosylmethionine ribosyltransferase-isomerase QueA [bacterium]